MVAVVPDELAHAVESFDHLVVAGGGQAPGAQQVVGVGEAVDGEALAGADAVDDHVQRAGGGDPGVLLAQGAGGGVARVGEGLLAGFDEAGVELLELLHREEDLAADLHQGGEVVAVQPLGDVRDGADVGGDVLADAAVAAVAARVRRPCS